MTPRVLVPPVEGAEIVRLGQTPTFSVCISAYQVASLIGDALTSLFDQTVAPHEVIVCDDGSTDELDTALAPFRDRITLVRQENKGMASARNSAVDRATGDFVVFLDADDRFEPPRIERLGALAMERPDLDMLTTDANIEIDGAIIHAFYTPTNRFVVGDQRVGILSSNFVFGLAAVRRTVLVGAGGFDVSVPVVEDWDCWIRLILGGARVGLVDEPLAVYRVRSGSGSSDRIRLLRGRIDVLGRALARTDLTGRERHVAGDALAEATRMLALAEVQQALVDGDTDARSRSRRIVADRGFSLSSRVKAMCGVAAPRATGKRLRRRRAQRSKDPAAMLAERE
jgi:GT2 family glycosyltransferase